MADHEEVRPSGPETDTGYPVIGETTVGFGAHLIRSGKLKDEAAYARLRRDAVDIVRRCRRFGKPDGSTTGLVVGYVQSGKTMSMTAVSALARDNGCRIVVLLAGVTTNLLNQNANRFREDLRAASGKMAWRIINSSNWNNETAAAGDLQHLQRAVAEWRDPTVTEASRQTFLFMVLKNHVHLDSLHKLLAAVDLKGVPALILDDEADQAGLNTKPDRAEGSTTYEQIRKVRAALSNHTYLQYTATPQAPLLIALDDMLSPAFAELVEPGDGYTGGPSFFGGAAQPQLVRAVPQADLFRPGEPPQEPPDSLIEALRIFFVGCAVSAVRKGPNPFSMLVHPSQRKADHSRYLGWIHAIVRRWADALRSTEPDDKKDTVDEFRLAYDDLAKTDHELPEFESLIPGIKLSLGRVSLKEVNGADGSEVDWDNAAEHILVGGEKLNRGFTVEGLAVTYMPRGTGEWNADTIQQRARFFGYKAKYLSLCRLYLHPEVIHAFRSYVLHEDDIRKQLAAHRGKPLREWRRAFFLDKAMRPSRKSIMLDPYYKVPADQLWFLQRQPHTDPQAIATNIKLVSAFEKSLKFEEAKEVFFKNLIAEVPLKQLLEELLVAYDVRDGDRPGWYGQLVTLTDILEAAPQAIALVVKMHGERARAATDGGIPLQQGASSKAGNYPGDNKMFDATRVTVQIHTIDIRDGGPKGIAALAVHIPRPLRKDDVGTLVPYA